LLIVDDCLAFAKAEAAFLSSFPQVLTVAIAGNESQALAMAVKELPDLMLIDFELSGTASLQFATQLRQRFTKLRIVFLVDHDSRRLERVCRRRGADAVIFRDRARTELRKTINRLFPKRKSNNP
jgi:two-component system nitrate/nitrite response regulator NarP